MTGSRWVHKADKIKFFRLTKYGKFAPLFWVLDKMQALHFGKCTVNSIRRIHYVDWRFWVFTFANYSPSCLCSGKWIPMYLQITAQNHPILSRLPMVLCTPRTTENCSELFVVLLTESPSYREDDFEFELNGVWVIGVTSSG